MSEPENNAENIEIEKIDIEQLKSLLDNLTPQEIKTDPFVLCLSVKDDGTASIIVGMDFDEQYFSKIAEALSSLCNGEYNTEILKAFSELCGQSVKKRKLVTKLLKKWEAIDNYPYVDPLQVSFNERKEGRQ